MFFLKFLLSFISPKTIERLLIHHPEIYRVDVFTSEDARKMEMQEFCDGGLGLDRWGDA